MDTFPWNVQLNTASFYFPHLKANQTSTHIAFKHSYSPVAAPIKKATSLTIFIRSKQHLFQHQKTIATQTKIEGSVGYPKPLRGFLQPYEHPLWRKSAAKGLTGPLGPHGNRSAAEVLLESIEFFKSTPRHTGGKHKQIFHTLCQRGFQRGQPSLSYWDRWRVSCTRGKIVMGPPPSPTSSFCLIFDVKKWNTDFCTLSSDTDGSS